MLGNDPPGGAARASTARALRNMAGAASRTTRRSIGEAPLCGEAGRAAALAPRRYSASPLGPPNAAHVSLRLDMATPPTPVTVSRTDLRPRRRAYATGSRGD